MGMRDGEIFDLGGLPAQRFKLRGERLWPTPVYSPRISRGLPVGHGGNGVSDSGVPKQPTLRVMHQVAVFGHIHRLADIDARGPARNVDGVAFGATEEVTITDARCALRASRR